MTYQYEFPGGPGPRRLTRSSRERMWAGVAGGLAEYFDLDPVIMRLIWVAGAILSGGLAVPVYLVMWWVMPRADQVGASQVISTPPQPREPVGASVGSEGGAAPEGAVSAGAGESVAGFESPVGEPRVEFESSIPPGFQSTVTPQADVPPFRQYPPFDRGRRRQQTAGLILIVIGLLFLSERMGVLGWFRLYYTWPILLIVFGVAMLFRQSSGWRR